MVFLKLKLIYEGDEQSNEFYHIQCSEPHIQLTPENIREKCNLGLSKRIVGFNGLIECENALIEIADFEYFTLKSYANINSSISILKVYGANNFFRLNDLQIKQAQFTNSNALIVNCEIRQFDLGIASKDSLSSMDIRESMIKNIRIFVPVKNINIQGSNVQRLNLWREFNDSDSITLGQGSTVENFNLSGKIQKLSLEDAVIKNLLVAAETSIEVLDITTSTIDNVYNSNLNTFKQKNINTWKLIANAAKNENNSYLFSLASFEYLKLERKYKSNGIQKLTLYIFEIICGYGYKPLRTILWSLGIWVCFALLYWFLSTPVYGLKLANGTIINGLKGLGYSFYFSLITFTTTAFGDIIPTGKIIKVLAGIQTVIGTLSLAMFIFSLTKRFGSFR